MNHYLLELVEEANGRATGSLPDFPGLAITAPSYLLMRTCLAVALKHTLRKYAYDNKKIPLPTSVDLDDMYIGADDQLRILFVNSMIDAGMTLLKVKQKATKNKEFMLNLVDFGTPLNIPETMLLFNLFNADVTFTITPQQPSL
jgi:hypothetical protein